MIRTPLNFKSAFTLAEVLITLAIIGVVAAMTIPTLVTKYKEKQTVTAVKKAYSVLSQALQVAILEHGTIDQWNLKTSYTGEKIEDNIERVDESSMEFFTERLSKYIRGELLQPGWDKDFVVSNMFNEPVSVIYAPDKQDAPTAIRLADGIILDTGYVGDASKCKRSDLAQHDDYCLVVSAVMLNNGNKISQGVNYFYFHVLKDRVVPAGISNVNLNSFERTCQYSINNRLSGRGCTAWVIEKGNLDYLHCEGLGWDGKSKCD